MCSVNDLYTQLKDIVDYVYFQPPESVKLQYPCVIYSLKDIKARKADNMPYTTSLGYSLLFMTKDPKDERIISFMNLEHCKFDRYYSADNVHHYSYTVYL